MLSSIKNSWPIAPSPAQMNTGYKHTTHKYNQAPVVEPLRTLRDTEWWTAVRIGTFGAEPTMVQIRVIDANGIQIGKEWIQESNAWFPLQWPIPGPMANGAGLALEVTLMEPNARIDPSITVRIGFHVLPDENTNRPLVFINDDNCAQFYWDEQQLIMHCDPPRGGCRAVNTMQFLLTN